MVDLNAGAVTCPQAVEAAGVSRGRRKAVLSVSSLLYGTLFQYSVPSCKQVITGKRERSLLVKVGLGPWNVKFKVIIPQLNSPPKDREGGSLISHLDGLT